jgi:hypothetical protein
MEEIKTIEKIIRSKLVITNEPGVNLAAKEITLLMLEEKKDLIKKLLSNNQALRILLLEKEIAEINSEIEKMK